MMILKKWFWVCRGPIFANKKLNLRHIQPPWVGRTVDERERDQPGCREEKQEQWCDIDQGKNLQQKLLKEVARSSSHPMYSR